MHTAFRIQAFRRKRTAALFSRVRPPSMICNEPAVLHNWPEDSSLRGVARRRFWPAVRELSPRLVTRDG
jgi:hypothetical protein